MKLETILNALILVSQLSLSDKSARQYDAFRDRILRMDAEKNQMIRDMAWIAYNDQVIDTGMKEHLIGEGNEFADMEDWIESWIYGLKLHMNANENI
jgi:hypothetical protein